MTLVSTTRLQNCQASRTSQPCEKADRPVSGPDLEPQITGTVRHASPVQYTMIVIF